MRLRYLLCCIIFLIFCHPSSFGREKIKIDFDWKFMLGDYEGAMNPQYDDSKWNMVNLPHDASIYGNFVKDSLGGTRQNGFRPRHIGWYRKHLNIKEELEGKRIFLEFEGVYRASDVWVNGIHCGSFLNGYLDFQYDITSLVKPGENIIAVRFDNTFKESSRWYTGEGITRDVYLNIVDNLHVDRYGTYVTTPKTAKDKAQVKVETNVINQSADSVQCRLITNILSPSGNIVASRTSLVPLGKNEKFEINQEFEVKDPAMWDIDNPQLYKAISSVYNKEQLVDTYETTFGIREIDFNPEQGFLLNGRKVFLKGVCLHHDLGPLGAASFDRAWEKRLDILKNKLGCNAIRLSHNPYPKYVLDWCDRNGMLVFDEAYDKWNEQYYGPGEKFEDHWKQDVETFLKRDRNHPSVFVWSVGNEVVQQQKKDKDTIESGVSILKEMLAFVHKLEPSRKVTCALYPARYNGIKYNDPKFYTSAPHQMAFYPDVMSVNYQSSFFKKDHEKYPQLIFLSSELATGEAGYDYFNYDHSYSCGQFYWGGTEYIGESFGWPSKGWINGAIDLCDNFKPVAYSIESFYSDRPMVQIAVLDKNKSENKLWNDAKISWKPMFFHWNWQKDEKLTVQTFTNCDSVQLFINGKSAGIESIMNKKLPQLFWNVAFEKGKIEARGIKNGKVVAKNVLSTAGDPYRILLEADRDTIKADGLDLSYITVKVVDKNGIVVPTASNKIFFSVSGEGTNAGVGNGNIMSNELWQANSRSAFNGECQLIVRSSGSNGKVAIEVHSKGLKPARLILHTL